MHKVIVHLVVLGKNPQTGAFSTALKKDDRGQYTISTTLDICPDETAKELAKKHIGAPLDWYNLIQQSFVCEADSRTIRLIYNATIPVNIRLNNNAKWYDIEEFGELELTDVERNVLLQGIKL